MQENTPADEQEEAAAETGAATVLPMLVDYDYEAEYDQDSYETLISIDIPKILVIEEGQMCIRDRRTDRACAVHV